MAILNINIPKEKKAKKEKKASDSFRYETHFDFLGFNMNEERMQQFYFYANSCKSIIRLSASKMTKQNLLMLAPLEFWCGMFPNNDGSSFSHVAVTDFLVRTCTQRGYFVEENIRGRGVWLDDEMVVFHCGTHLLVDNEKRELNFGSKYVYELRSEMRTAMAPLHVAESRKITQLLRGLNWDTPENGRLLSGWLLISTISSLLNWRPHVWITGGKHSGKSWVMDNICKAVLEDFCKAIQGNSTEAGLRQSLNGDVFPYLFDEADSSTDKGQARLQDIMELARASSSGNNSAILKGSKSGQASEFKVKSCFLLSSIIPNIRDDNDKRRFSVLGLSKLINDADFLKLDAFRKSFLTKDYARAFQMRAVFYASDILKSIEIFTNCITKITGNRAKGDQLGALIGGWWHTCYDNVVSENKAMEEAKNILLNMGIDKESEDVPDEIGCLQLILGAETRVESEDLNGHVKNSTLTIGELVKIVSIGGGRGVSKDDANDKLKRLGLKVDTYNNVEYLWIYNRSEFVKSLLKGTMFAMSHASALGRIEGSLKSVQGRYSEGILGRGTLIPISFILG